MKLDEGMIMSLFKRIPPGRRGSLLQALVTKSTQGLIPFNPGSLSSPNLTEDECDKITTGLIAKAFDALPVTQTSLKEELRGDNGAYMGDISTPLFSKTSKQSVRQLKVTLDNASQFKLFIIFSLGLNVRIGLNVNTKNKTLEIFYGRVLCIEIPFSNLRADSAMIIPLVDKDNASSDLTVKQLLTSGGIYTLRNDGMLKRLKWHNSPGYSSLDNALFLGDVVEYNKALENSYGGRPYTGDEAPWQVAAGAIAFTGMFIFAPEILGYLIAQATISATIGGVGAFLSYMFSEPASAKMVEPIVASAPKGVDEIWKVGQKFINEYSKGVCAKAVDVYCKEGHSELAMRNYTYMCPQACLMYIYGNNRMIDLAKKLAQYVASQPSTGQESLMADIAIKMQPTVDYCLKAATEVIRSGCEYAARFGVNLEKDKFIIGSKRIKDYVDEVVKGRGNGVIPDVTPVIGPVIPPVVPIVPVDPRPIPTPSDDSYYVVTPWGTMMSIKDPHTLKGLYELGDKFEKDAESYKMVYPNPQMKYAGDSFEGDYDGDLFGDIHADALIQGDEFMGDFRSFRKKLGNIAAKLTDPKSFVGKIINVAAKSGIPFISQVAGGINLAANIVQKANAFIDKFDGGGKGKITIGGNTADPSSGEANPITSLSLLPMIKKQMLEVSQMSPRVRSQALTQITEAYPPGVDSSSPM